MRGSLRPLTPVAITFLCLLALFWFGFKVLLEQRAHPNRALQADAGAPTRLVLEASQGGHYFVPGRINGERVSFLIDTGATSVAVPASLAEELGLERGMRIDVKTAGGTVFAYDTRIDSIAIGGIRLHDIRGTISPTMNDATVLLGMSFLRRLNFRQDNGRLILTRRK